MKPDHVKKPGIKSLFHLHSRLSQRRMQLQEQMWASKLSDERTVTVRDTDT